MNSDVKTVFEDIARHIPDLCIKEYPTTAGKVGIRLRNTVIFTYNSYKKGWLDTNAELGPRLPWFKFQPTHNKPARYWATKVSPQKIKQTYEAHRTKILGVLRLACEVQAEVRE